jgi:hypothetical protein
MSITNSNMPKSIRYGLMGASAVQAETTLARFSSVNGNVYSSTASNEIRIRFSANGFMQTEKHYLHFQITTAAADAVIDTHAGCVFDRMTIEANGSIVEQINSYGLYNAIRQNYNNDVNDIYKKVTESGSGGLNCKNTVGAFANVSGADVAALITSVNAQKNAFIAATNGLLLPVENSAAGEFITSGHSKHFVIQLESGLLKNNLGKALPMGLTELELVLRLAPNTQALASAGAVTYTITNPTLYCPVMQVLNGDVLASYRSVVAQEGIMWSGTTAKTYINAVPLAAGTKTLQINDRSISCLGMVTALRKATADSTNAIYSNGSFGYTDVNSTDKITEFHYQINGQNFPASNLKLSVAENGLNLGRAQEETLKALAKHGEDYAKSTVSVGQLVNEFDGVYAASPATTGTNVPRGLFSVDLKKMSDDGLRMVGYNSAQNSSPSILELDCTVALQNACTATTFSLVESFYQMSANGDLSSAM